MSSRQLKDAKPAQLNQSSRELTTASNRSKGFNEYFGNETVEEELQIYVGEQSFRSQPSTVRSEGLYGEEDAGEGAAMAEDTDEEIGDVEQDELDYDILALQSPPSTTFSELANRSSFRPLKNKPAYRKVVTYIKALLEELVNRNSENVLSHFGEWSMRVFNNLSNTFGVSQEVFLATAFNYLYSLKSFTFGWRDAVEEYIHEYGPEILGEDALLEELRMGMEVEGEGEDGIKTVDDVIIKEDDWDEGGYKHYLERRAEPKEPPFDEFEYVTMEQMSFFEEAGAGLPRLEQYEIHMALFRLAKVRNLTEVRFWGKVFGLYQNYYIAEAVMKPEDMKIDDFDELPQYEESEFVGEYCEDLLLDELLGEELKPEDIGQFGEEEYEGEMLMEEMRGEYRGEFDEEQTLLSQVPPVKFDDVPPLMEAPEMGYGAEEEGEMFGEQESVFELRVDDGTFKGKMNLKNYELPQLPRIKWKPLKETPMEDPGKGTNKFVFFVTNDPKSDWLRLPHVTPEQIVVARQIRKFFTGYLTSRVNSYPKFPGIEMNLLRAQIARISAGTQVSPAGYYRFDEGEEEAEAVNNSDEQGGKIVLNDDFEPLTVKDLTDPTCTFWVHHTAFILNQGRTVWVNVNQKSAKELLAQQREQEGEEEGPMAADVIGEKGPPLLTSCSEDLFIETIPPWTAKPSIELAVHEGCVYVRSNSWPGSYSFSYAKKIGFMYHGWGVKSVTYGYTPPSPGFPQTEYPTGPTIIETTDPTPYQEEEYALKVLEWQKKKEKQPHPMMEGEGGEGSDDDV